MAVERVHGVRRVLRACVNSRDGLVALLRTEEAARAEAVVLVAALLVAPLVARTVLTGVLLVGVVVFVLVVEALNTAIEKLADRVQPEFDPAIRTVKDLGSLAVGLSILLGLAVWGAVIVDRILG